MSKEINVNDNQNMPENDSVQAQPVNDNQNMPVNDNQNILENDSTNPYQAIIEQQQAQINALIEQTTALNNQIVNMVNNGAQFNDNSQVSQVVQPELPLSLSDDKDYSLESLAKEIGRKHG